MELQIKKKRTADMDEEEAIVKNNIEDEDDDDEFCEQLLKEYEADPDKGQCITAEEMAELCGVDLNDL